MNLLRTKSLTIGYGKRGEYKVLQKDINVSILPGQIISLIGQNGVGKTTFIKTISGLLPAINGEVYFADKRLDALSPLDLSKKLSLVLTEKPFASGISVIELIAIGRHPYSNWLGVLSPKDKEIIEWAITETNLNYLADKKLYELSDGQLQKVMIARALSQETDLIILDEPTAHLDLHNKIEVMLLLRKIASQGKGILISTHDLQLSTQLSDKLWLFNFNLPVQEGLPEDLVLNGRLEETLFIKNYGYNLMNGCLDLLPEGEGFALYGNEESVFWTRQALKRNGYKVADDAGPSIYCKKGRWTLVYDEVKTDHPDIASLLIEIAKKVKPR